MALTPTTRTELEAALHHLAFAWRAANPDFDAPDDIDAIHTAIDQIISILDEHETEVAVDMGDGNVLICHRQAQGNLHIYERRLISKGN